ARRGHEGGEQARGRRCPREPRDLGRRVRGPFARLLRHEPRPLGARAAPRAVTSLEAQMTVIAGSGEGAFTVEAELTLSEGVLVLFGPSGAGKSLTVQAIAGLIKPARGFLRVQGETLFDKERRIWVAPHRRRIGYVPQLHALFPFLDVFGNIAF